MPCCWRSWRKNFGVWMEWPIVNTGGGMVGSEWRIPENGGHDLVTSIVVLLEGLGQANAEVDFAEGVGAERFGFQSVDHRQIGKLQSVVDAVKFESGIVISDRLAIADLGSDGNGDAAGSFQQKRNVLRD